MNFRLFKKFQKEFADDNLKFHEKGRKFSHWEENTVEKGEIARYEQFLPFSRNVFVRLVLQTRKNKGLFGKGLNNDVKRGRGVKKGGVARVKTGLHLGC